MQLKLCLLGFFLAGYLSSSGTYAMEARDNDEKNNKPKKLTSSNINHKESKVITENSKENSSVHIGETNIPLGVVCNIIRHCENESDYKVERYKDIWQARLLAKDWKKAADQVIWEDKLLCIFLSPTNYKDSYDPERTASLARVAPLAWQISFIKWKKSFENMQEALTICPFPNLQVISYVQRDNYLPEWDNTLNLKDRDGARILAEVLPRFSTLETLHISSEMGEKGPVFSSALPHLINLKKIYISGQMEQQGVIDFFYTMQKLKKLNSVRLSTKTGEGGGLFIATSLKAFSRTLTDLTLTGSHMGPEAVKAIAKNLQFIPSLKTLILEDSESGDEGTVQIAANIRFTPLLEVLNLGCQYSGGNVWGNEGNIQVAGYDALCKAIPEHRNLKIVWLHGNKLEGCVSKVQNMEGKNVTIILKKSIYPWKIKGHYKDYRGY